MSKIYKNNKSGIPGVCYKVRDARWCATINVNGEKIQLGNFTNKEDAVNARVEAEKFYKFRFNDKDGFKLIHYALQIELNLDETNKDYSQYYNLYIPTLFYAAKTYDGTVSFRKHAVDMMKTVRTNVDVKCEEIYPLPNYYVDWLNGDTMSQISKRYGTPLTTLSRSINEMNKKIK